MFLAVMDMALGYHLKAAGEKGRGRDAEGSQKMLENAC
jgi:hypothetical protein